MIKSRLEAKRLKIWLFCIVLFIIAAIAASCVIGFLSESLVYKWLPFLDFNLTLSGTFMGQELPSWLTENFSFVCSILCVAVIIAIFAYFIYLIALCIYGLQRKHAEKVLRKTGYSKEYYDLLEKKRRKLSGTSLSARNDILVAKAYCDGRRYDDAFAVLRDIDLDRFDSKLAARYYTLYAYLFLLTGDIESAKSTVELGKPFCSKYPDMPEKLLVDALIKYADKDFYGAKDGFEALLNVRPIEVRVWAGLYLGLVYLRLRKKELARKLVGTLGKYKKTPRQSEDMIKLLKKIETAYALEAEEKSDGAGDVASANADTAEDNAPAGEAVENVTVDEAGDAADNRDDSAGENAESAEDKPEISDSENTGGEIKPEDEE